ncbi:MAG: hypothetical protein Q9225_002471 [Loekoesia sp. 1 TL-2023]
MSEPNIDIEDMSVTEEHEVQGLTTDVDVSGEPDEDTREPDAEIPGQSHDLRSSHGLASQPRPSNTTSTKADKGQRRPTKEERAAAQARVEEMKDERDSVWRSRKEKAEFESEMDRNLKIAHGGSIADPKPPKKRGRPPNKKPRIKKVYEDSEPEADHHGYLPGEREMEEKRLERAIQKGRSFKKLVQKPDREESPATDQWGYPIDNSIGQRAKPRKDEGRFSDDSEAESEPSPPSKRRRSLRSTEKTSGKKDKLHKFTPDDSPYAPSLPPARKLGRVSFNPHQPPVQESPYSSTPHYSQSHAPSHSFFEQRLASIAHGNPNPHAHYPPGFDGPPSYANALQEGHPSAYSGSFDLAGGYPIHSHHSRDNIDLNSTDLYRNQDSREDAGSGAHEELLY